MPKLTVPAFDTLPDGIYGAHFAGVTEKESDLGPYWQWGFDVPYKGTVARRTVNTSLNSGPRSKAYQHTTAIAGRRPRPGEEVELDDLIRAPCQVQISTEISLDGRKFNKIVAVLPAPRADTTDDEEGELQF